MATESPIRVMEAGGKWPSQAAYGKSSTNMNMEELGLKGQNIQGKQRTLPPNRSGSAPPNMEASLGAIENLMSRHKIPANATPNRESEEQLCSDPSYFAYYSANVNLNPRLPQPLVHDGNRRRATSFDDSISTDGSFHLTQINLSTHKEESDDDQSPKHESAEDTGQLSYSNPAISASSSVNRSSVAHSEDDASSSAVTDADVSSITNGIAAINTSSITNAESQSQRGRQQRSMLQVYAPQHQMLSQGQSYIGMNQFPQSPSNFSADLQRMLQSSGFPTPPYASNPAYMISGNQVYPNMISSAYFPQQYTVSGYTVDPPYATGYLPPSPFGFNASASFIGQSQTPGVNMQHMNKFYGHPGLPIQPPFTESLHGDDQIPKQLPFGFMGNSNLNSRRVDTTSPYYFGSPTTNIGILQFPNTSFASPGGGGGFPGGGNRMQSASGLYGGWQPHNEPHVFKDPKTYSFLEELKSGKGRRLELSDIFGHIVEFCGDQHGSRFIQQKLEICSVDEKESVFMEVLPCASSLITDVFGNYVIQKFFEHGSAEQRKELANQLESQILPLSLQMYGCRVIQKALDVIELEQKIKLVHELDGHVLRCVRDQNGNHVIQKCIESIPMEKIAFITASFRGQVTALSTHPYGCRVIQRVLEHSSDELQSQFIVDEILESVYTLAQDQYGNYVTQHVLKRGKPEERMRVVKKLAGHVVQLSQHKFASNVIEKCLEFGDSTAKGILIGEIVGLGDDNDNLLAMVKDQFANYVIQKVLQTCTGDQREVLLGRIKIHLNSLKKYTYGKHIVTRFEQLYGEEVQTSDS